LTPAAAALAAAAPPPLAPTALAGGALGPAVAAYLADHGCPDGSSIATSSTTAWLDALEAFIYARLGDALEGGGPAIIAVVAAPFAAAPAHAEAPQPWPPAPIAGSLAALAARDAGAMVPALTAPHQRPPASFVSAVAAAVKRRLTGDGGVGGEWERHRRRRRVEPPPLTQATQAALGGIRSALAAARLEGAAFAEWLAREADGDVGSAADLADPLGLRRWSGGGGGGERGGGVVVAQNGHHSPAAAFAAEAARARALTAAMQEAAGWRF
jgi:hypothetical protein